MSNVPNVDSSSNSQYSSNPAINNNNSNANVSAFFILAEAMSRSVDDASKSLDSKTLEQNEKQAILKELQGITDLAQKKRVIEFFIKTLGSGDASLKTWLTGLKNQNEDVINKIWKLLYGYYKDATGTTVTDGGNLTSQIDEDDEKEKKYGGSGNGNGGWNIFKGDYEWKSNLSKQRLALIDNIKQLMQNPDEAANNLSQLSSDFQGLQSIVKQENKETENLSKPANWWSKHVTGKLNNAIIGICKGKYNWLADIGMPAMALVDGLMYVVQGVLSVPAAIYGGPQKTILKDTSTLATNGLLEVQSAQSSNAIMNGQFRIDANTVSSRIQKGTEALSKYNELLENSVANSSKLITNVNYSSKV